MKIDYISDLHAESWLKKFGNERKLSMHITNFIKNILPDEIGDILILAGDISNYNHITFSILEELNKYYPQIYLVLGNHDYYLPSKTQVNIYESSSYKRILDLKCWLLFRNGIKLLDGNIETLPNGMTLGGASGWYDFSYDDSFSYIQKFPYYKEHSNDYQCIRNILHSSHFVDEKEKVANIMDADIIVTHVPPTFNILDTSEVEDKRLLEMCAFNGEDIINNTKARYWIYGHMHKEGMSMNYKGIEFKINSCGLPSENLNTVIQSITIGE